jgi:hypothetical protein
MGAVLKAFGGSDGRRFLLTESADNVIFEWFMSGSEEFKQMQLNDFIGESLLCTRSYLVSEMLPLHVIPFS